jgi:uncharacterized membrane-anchored protein YitT (DUF2179 family)
MNPIFQSILLNYSRKRAKHLGQPPHRRPTKTDLRTFKAEVRTQIGQAFMIVCGALSAGLGLKGFLLPNGFIDGGVTGMSLLISEVYNFSLPILIVLINLPFIFLGYKQFGRLFAIKSFCAILLLSIFVYSVPYPILTNDKLLVAVFGGFFLGAGIGLAVRGNSVIDGTEILAITVSKRSTLSVGDVILIINIGIFSVAAFVLSFEQALYSVLTYMSAAKTVDYILEGIEEYTGVTIISKKNEIIRSYIINQMGRGVTIYKGKEGFGMHGERKDMDILFTVITRLEFATLKSEVKKVDREAFMIAHSINDTRGGMIKKRPLH